MVRWDGKEDRSWMTREQKRKAEQQDRLVNLIMFCVVVLAAAYLIFVA